MQAVDPINYSFQLFLSVQGVCEVFKDLFSQNSGKNNIICICFDRPNIITFLFVHPVLL